MKDFGAAKKTLGMRIT
jgi:hypothetical protein